MVEAGRRCSYQLEVPNLLLDHFAEVSLRRRNSPKRTDGFPPVLPVFGRSAHSQGRRAAASLHPNTAALLLECGSNRYKLTQAPFGFDPLARLGGSRARTVAVCGDPFLSELPSRSVSQRPQNAKPT